MPANLTVQYQLAEQDYRRAATAHERLECLLRMLQLVPKHKGSEKIQAELKTRIKHARAALNQQQDRSRGGRRCRIPRQGAGQVVLVGGPNAGKSRVLAELTNAAATATEWAYSTTEPLPGMTTFEDVPIQLIDTPSISAAHFESYLTGMLRAADAVVFCFDGSSDDAPQASAEVLAQLKQRKIELARTTGLSTEDLSVVRLRTLLLITRGRSDECETREALFHEFVDEPFETLCIDWDDCSAHQRVRRAVFRTLDVIRVFTRRPGEPSCDPVPVTIPARGTVESLALRIHEDFYQKFRFARIWRNGDLFASQASIDTPLRDGDVVELHQR